MQQDSQSLNPYTSARDNSTTMTAISKALADIDAQDAEGQVCYCAVAKKHGVEVSTLTRRHHGHTQSREAAAQRQLLTPSQEAELVKHTQRLSERGMPPARAMLKKNMWRLLCITSRLIAGLLGFFTAMTNLSPSKPLPVSIAIASKLMILKVSLVLSSPSRKSRKFQHPAPQYLQHRRERLPP